MDLRVSNWAAATAVSLVLAALAGCSGAEPDNAPPPPPPEMTYAPAPMDLAGAPPPAPDSSGLAGGAPEAPPAPAVVAMAPIPNPEDLPPAERHRIYGTAYDGGARVDHGPASHPAERAAAAPTRPVVAARPRPIKPAPARPAAVAGPPVAEKPAAPAVATPTAAEGVQRGIFNWGNVDVPGVGRMRWETVVGSGLLLLALLALVAIARNASEGEARARRQKAAEKVQAETAPHGADGPATPVEAPSEPKAP